MRVVGIAVGAFALAGCTAVDKPGEVGQALTSVTQTGYTSVLPNTNVRVGRLYFSGVGKRPAFVTTGGVVYNEICYDDFRETKALSEISKFVFDDGISIKKQTISSGLSGSAAVSTSKLKVLGNVMLSGDASRNRTYVIENFRLLSLSDRGQQIVRDNLGDNCRQEIAKLQQQNISVILALSAQRADKAIDTTTNQVSGAAGGTIGGQIESEQGKKVKVSGDGLGIGGGSSNNQIGEYELVYLSIRPSNL